MNIDLTKKEMLLLYDLIWVKLHNPPHMDSKSNYYVKIGNKIHKAYYRKVK